MLINECCSVFDVAYNYKGFQKPTGWRGESFRHYLAAKGIKTKRQYFVRNELKGNRSSSSLHRAFAKGFSKEDLRSDPSAREAFGVSLEELKSTGSRSRFPEDLSRSEELVSATGPTLSEGEPLPEITTTVVGGDVGESSIETEPNMVMSPGVPPAPPGPDSAFFKLKNEYMQQKTLVGRAFDVSGQVRRRRASGAAARTEQSAEVTRRAAENASLSPSEEAVVAQERAELPKSAAERQARLERPQDAKFEELLRIPDTSFTRIQNKSEGKKLANKFNTQFFNEDRGKEALSEVNRRLQLEQSKVGSARNVGRITFLNEARRDLVKEYGSGPQKQRLRDEVEFASEISKKKRVAPKAAPKKKGKSSKRTPKKTEDILKSPEFQSLVKEGERVREMQKVRRGQ